MKQQRPSNEALQVLKEASVKVSQRDRDIGIHYVDPITGHHFKIIKDLPDNVLREITPHLAMVYHKLFYGRREK